MGRALIVALAADLLLRLRAIAQSPVAWTRPALDVFRGTAGAFALLSVCAFAAILLGALMPVLGRILFAAFVVVRTVVAFVWFEAFIYFGHRPRALDGEAGFNLSFYVDSLRSRTGVELGILLAAVSAALYFAARSARRARRGIAPIWAAAAAVLGCAFLMLAPAAPDAGRDPVVESYRLARSRQRPARQTSPPVAPLADATAVRALLPPSLRGAVIDPAFPLATHGRRERSGPKLPPGVRPNIVFLLLEGLQAEEVGAEGGSPPGLTPNLDRLAAKGYLFRSAYSPGSHTDEGELAAWYGLLPLPREWLMPDRPGVVLSGLPEALKALGWRDFVWMYGGDQTFYGRARFYGQRGFRYFDAADFPASDPRTSWGFSDLSLSHRSLAVLRSAAEPFAAMFVTISNHHPFRVPTDARSRFDPPNLESGCRGHYTCRMLQTIHYSDQAVGDFFARASNEPWFSRTIFVVSGDHGLPIEPYGFENPTPHQYEEFQHRIPIMIYSPLLPGGSVVSDPVSQTDLAPTLLDLVAPAMPRAGIGIDLLSSDREDRPIVLWSGESHTLSVVTRNRIYHATVHLSAKPFPSLENEQLVDPGRDPRGLVNLAPGEPAAVAAARAVCDAYLRDYPVVVDSGRSGLPPDKSANASPRERGSQLPGP